jgi:uncharacterized protein YuzE
MRPPRRAAAIPQLPTLLHHSLGHDHRYDISMVTLISVLPDIVAELAAALGSQGRADLSAQLASATIERCTFDPTVKAGYIYLARPHHSAFAETFAFAEPSLNIDVDIQASIIGIEVLGRTDVFSMLRSAGALTIGSSDRGSRLRWAKEGVDDWDKVPSFDAGRAPRRSTSSLCVPLVWSQWFYWVAARP